MSSIFRRWKNRLRCSNKRHMPHSRSSIINDPELKTVNVTMDKLVNENRILKERFDKLDERCQRWIGDEQTYLLKRIEQLENENRQLHDNHRTYQIKSEKCIESVTDLIVKILFTQENESIIQSTRSISCQFTSNHTNQVQRHTTNDQSTWVHQRLMIVEKNDEKTTNQLSGMQ
ncbi:unnamed protein product [Adineta steineri]|uniref:Uncharacterized protein n=1 Tax=Adineta steineri TaxID=433720 RepID=A0A819JMB4_9BILA|nr:unnamed protein product [Adineta steineri]CAF0914595.1 unnamed protein product [Adineta steineri]CAF1041694.1 unnamed protein product [Adineta steineri]CAF3485279.1 unnamed protein product [Adineta steineri]CAF3768997.1 unnamed protein product [Adineta steineri]